MGEFNPKKRLVQEVLKLFKTKGDISKQITGGSHKPTSFFGSEGIKVRKQIDALGKRQGMDAEGNIHLVRDPKNVIKEQKFSGVSNVGEDVDELQDTVHLLRKSEHELRELGPFADELGSVPKKLKKTAKKDIEEIKESTKDFIKNFGGSEEFRKQKRAFEKAMESFRN
tara:strand:- start:33 stop:539 length:507 start_codon:yes stop_codon:yes gene_type:complete